MSDDVSRRAFLGAVTTAATAALAGCTGGDRPPLEPRVPQRALEEDGWRHVDDIEERVREDIELPVVEPTVEVHMRGTVYANPRPTERVSQQFDVGTLPFQPPPAQFVPMKMETDPPVHRLTGVSNTLNEQLLDQIEERAMEQLGDNGLRNLRRVDEGDLDIDAADTAVHRRYRGEYTYGRTRTEIAGRPVTVEPGTFEIEAQLAVWPYEGLLAVAGGAYPGEPSTVELTVDDTTREVDLGLRPRQYRQSVRELTTLVS